MFRIATLKILPYQVTSLPTPGTSSRKSNPVPAVWGWDGDGVWGVFTLKTDKQSPRHFILRTVFLLTVIQHFLRVQTRITIPSFFD